MVLDGKQKMDVKVEVQVDVAAQNFQLTVVEVGAPPTEQLVTRAHSTVTGGAGNHSRGASDCASC